MNGVKSEKASVRVICGLLISAWIGVSQTQAAQCVALPNGEEVMDIYGEWDAEFENYGPWSQYGSYSSAIQIILDVNTFIGKRLNATKYHSAGTECFRCELDKNGVTKLQLITGMGPIDAKGELSDDGRKLTFDDGKKTFSTMIRQ